MNTLKLPPVGNGYSNGTEVNSRGTWGSYWATADASNSYVSPALEFYSTHLQYFGSSSTSPRAVRCFKNTSGKTLSYQLN